MSQSQSQPDPPPASSSTPTPALAPVPAPDPLTLARARLSRAYKASNSRTGIHAVSFQPQLDKPNQDRVATLHWSIAGHDWLFLAVCDGHAGSATSDYTARRLPARIHAALTSLPPTSLTSTPPSSTPFSPARISHLLTREIEAFDRHIGRALTKLVPRPESLSESDVRALVDDPEKVRVLQRANHGTTVAAALVDLSAKRMWAVGVGDSTVALVSGGGGGKRKAERLNELHSPTNPKEYFRIAMEHPGESERAIMRDSDRVLGAISLTRAIGDFSMKLPQTYLSRLLIHLPTTAHPEHLQQILHNSRTPPYLSCTPSVRYVDLEPLWEDGPQVLVFSDGVDAAVEGAFGFRAEDPSKADPVSVVAALLPSPSHSSPASDTDSDSWLRSILGHPIQRNWHPTNRAVDILANLFGGTDVARLMRVTDQEVLKERGSFRVDDTSLVVCDLRRAAEAGTTTVREEDEVDEGGVEGER